MRVLTNLSVGSISEVLLELEQKLMEPVDQVYVLDLGSDDGRRTLEVGNHVAEASSVKHIPVFSATRGTVAVIDSKKDNSFGLFISAGCGLLYPIYLYQNGTLVQLLPPKAEQYLHPILMASILELCRIAEDMVMEDFDSLKVDFEQVHKAVTRLMDVYQTRLSEHLKGALSEVFDKNQG